MTKITRLASALGFVASLAITPAFGLDLKNDVAIHGFGGWAVGDTDGNKYLGGASNRGFDARSFALNIAAQPTDQLSVHAQAFWGTPTGNPEVLVSELDFAFAQWKFSDAANLRAGIVKTPFGIYTELFEVGTVRPFFDLPQGMYGPSEVIAKGYFGVGFTGRTGSVDGWELQYDIYGGEIELDSLAAANPLLFSAGPEPAAGGEGGEGGEGEAPTRKLVDMLGGRLNLSTPLPGLRFGFSAFTGVPEVEGGGGAGVGDSPKSQTVIGAHLEYLSDKWAVRAEAAQRDGGVGDMNIDASYLEVSYYLTEVWQLAARYDQADLEVREEPERVPLPSFTEHEDIALGVNYWFSPGFVMKASIHWVSGNLFAIPGRNPKILQKMPLDSDTTLFQVGFQFSF